MRPKGSSAALEQRRRDAVAMLRQGSKPAEVAKALASGGDAGSDDASAKLEPAERA